MRYYRNNNPEISLLGYLGVIERLFCVYFGVITLHKTDHINDINTSSIYLSFLRDEPRLSCTAGGSAYQPATFGSTKYKPTLKRVVNVCEWKRGVFVYGQSIRFNHVVLCFVIRNDGNIVLKCVERVTECISEKKP